MGACAVQLQATARPSFGVRSLGTLYLLHVDGSVRVVPLGCVYNKNIIERQDKDMAENTHNNNSQIN